MVDTYLKNGQPRSISMNISWSKNTSSILLCSLVEPFPMIVIIQYYALIVWPCNLIYMYPLYTSRKISHSNNQWGLQLSLYVILVRSTNNIEG